MGKHAGDAEVRTDGSWVGNDDEVIQGPANPAGDDNISDEGNVIEDPNA